MDTVFQFDGLSLETEAGVPGDYLQSPTVTSLTLFATTPLSALSGATGGGGVG
jgi:hypothetical protein